MIGSDKADAVRRTVACMGDGSVRFVGNSVDLVTVWRPLVTIAGGEVVGDIEMGVGQWK